MEATRFMPLILGLIIFSFLVTSIFVVPFINLLYKYKLTRRKEAPKNGKVPLFDKLHDIKAGTPVGGGVLLITIVCVLFAILFPISSKMGVFIQTAYKLREELFVIFFTFISFGVLGGVDDLIKTFGRPTRGVLGLAFGMTRKQKFIVQWILGFVIGYLIYRNLGVHILHIPLFGKLLDLGFWYVPFAAFVIVSFTNAFNITDGLDGLSCGLLMICLIVFIVIAGSMLDTPLSMFIALWLGALIAYLYFNVYPARLFLGDGGALAFGAMLAVIGLLTGKIIAVVVIGGIFVIEIASSAIQIIGRKLFKRGVFPLAPIHHTFLAIGWEEPKIVMRAWLAGVIFAIFGLWLTTI
ncbi:MAG: phospho-N-acetylmuramoyl-pentapeptide-transferase [Candidatus Woesebacteria bacterium]|nr:phospho-N-acetylmuramoyl-pentapeptide-transferase [Candidatus Woesebacteria bacterium]